MKMFYVLLISCLGLAQQTLAEEIIQHSAGEVCVLPDRLPIDDVDYSKKDLKTEKKLCSYDFHSETSSASTTTVALCPKLFSTYPAVELIELPEGSVKSEYEKKCATKQLAEKIKVKNSPNTKILCRALKHPLLLATTMCLVPSA